VENVRIDKGVKRGPRKPPAPPRAPRNPTGVSAKLGPAFDYLSIVQRYIHGERTVDIASSLNVHRTALNYHLLRHCENEWKDAQVAIGITDLQQAEEDLETAADALALARAREQLRGAQWRLERLCSRLYGPKQEVTLTVPEVALRFGRADPKPENAAVLPHIPGESERVIGE
jgi:hypothetical protein